MASTRKLLHRAESLREGSWRPSVYSTKDGKPVDKGELRRAIEENHSKCGEADSPIGE